MVGTYEVVVLSLGALLALAVVGVCLVRGYFFRYLFLNLYLLSTVCITAGGAYLIRTEGYSSAAYFYFYYTADGIQNVIAYLLIASFFDQMFRRSVFHQYVRPTLGIFFLLVVGISGLFISRNVSQQIYSAFFLEFEQNMFFVGVLLTFLLWISMNYLRAESRRFVLLVSGLGIYFSAHAANYALQFLVRDLGPVLVKVPPLAYTFMVLLWLYTFWRVPEGEPAVEVASRAGPREVPATVSISRE